jgi:phosphatidylethanolamine/phosphatidyl-N-methylethanolamine N-methyltransferase
VRSRAAAVSKMTIGSADAEAAIASRTTSTYADFLRGLWDDPKAVSAPTPSGKALAHAIAAEVDPRTPGLVVELGAGTGTITSALIKRGVREERLALFESVQAFHTLLSRRFPRATVRCGDAFRFDRDLPEDARIAAVVSGIPLLNYPIAERVCLIERALDRQGPGAAFIQLSYGWWPPISPGIGVRLSRRVIFRNFPPAHIWVYRRAAAKCAQPSEAKAS